MRDAFIARFYELAKADPRLMLITGDLGYGVLDNYRAEMGDQFLNAGVAEQNMTGVAVGMAMEGHIVFTYSIANFPVLRCLEQIRNDAAYHDTNVKIVAIGGGFSYGGHGMSHHATEDLAIMRALPGVTVLVPGCLWEVEQATEALVSTPGVGYLRLDKSHAGRTDRPGERFEVGVPRRLREGGDVTLIGTGGILAELLAASDELRLEHGINARVVNVHTLKPFGAAEIVASALETGGIVTVEEHVLEGGLGGAVAETLLDRAVMPKAFHRLALRAGYSSIVGSQEYLRARYGMDKSAIVSAAVRIARRPVGSRAG